MNFEKNTKYICDCNIINLYKGKLDSISNICSICKHHSNNNKNFVMCNKCGTIYCRSCVDM